MPFDIVVEDIVLVGMFEASSIDHRGFGRINFSQLAYPVQRAFHILVLTCLKVIDTSVVEASFIVAKSHKLVASYLVNSITSWQVLIHLVHSSTFTANTYHYLKV